MALNETIEKDCTCSEECTCSETCTCTEDNRCSDNCTCQAETEKKHKKDKGKKELAKIKEALEKKEAECVSLLQKVQYGQAELINYRKRKEEELDTRLKYANQDLICEIIPILDNFERAIRFDDNDLTDELSKFLTGFKMMYATLNETLKKYGVEEIDCFDQPFNPNEMQALMTDQEETKEDGVVLEVLLKGYKLKGRVIRPASVKVNKLEGKEEKNNE